MRHFVLFLLFLMLPVAVFAGVGNVDNRYYVDDATWATDPYKKFVLLTEDICLETTDDEGRTRKRCTSNGTCTAQYISPNLILSAGHCVRKCTIIDEVIYTHEYEIKNYKNEEFKVKLIETPYDGKSWGTGDWAILLVTNSKYYSDAYFNVNVPIATTDVLNAGFGWMRILPNDELKKIREIFEEIVKEEEKEEGLHFTSFRFLRGKLEERLKEKGIEPLKEQYPQLKASKCKIVFQDCKEIITKGIKIESSDKKNKQKKSDRLQQKFERICNNQPLFREETYPYVLATTCDTMGGNSGGGYVSENGKNLYGVCSYGHDSLYDASEWGYIASSKQFNSRVKELIKIYDFKNSVQDNIAKIPENVFTAVRNDCDIEPEDKPAETGTKQQMFRSLSFNSSEPMQESEILDALPNIQNMTDDRFLNFLDKYVEYQVKYEKALEREQSFANRALTAASVAVAGIGGMELAQGLAEQRADKAAEQSMDAHIATMRCKYGNDQVKAGLDEIELPGGNDETMMNLRNEYFALAADLKERKTALGLAPGIESETIMDKSTMGLYDNENIGISDGVYSSLYRAKMQNSEKDQTQIKEAQESSQNRVNIGGTAAGAGVIGGAVGDMMINGKMKK